LKNDIKNDKRKIKYGIIEKSDAIDDLLNWNNFAFAGRT
jgi:hypothetical protein